MIPVEKVIGQDFQGWPICKMTLREILEKLGLTKISNRGVDYWQIADNDPILDVYPQSVEDDGMGYGVNEQFVIEVDDNQRGAERKVLIWVDKYHQNEVDAVKAALEDR